MNRYRVTAYPHNRDLPISEYLVNAEFASHAIAEIAEKTGIPSSQMIVEKEWVVVNPND